MTKGFVPPSLSQLKRFADHVSDGIWEVDAEGKTVFVNRRMAEMLGYSPDELAALDDRRGLAQKDLATDLDFWHGRPFVASEPAEWRLRRRDGSSVWTRALVVPLRDEAERTVGAFAIFTDLTAQKRAEHALKESEALYRRQSQLLELAHDAIIVRDFESKVIFWNAAAEKIYGWTKENALGRVTHDLLQTHFPAPLASIQADLVRDGHWQGELVHRRSDGVEVIMDSRWAVQRDDSGHPSVILEINRDITESRKARLSAQENGALAERQFTELQAVYAATPIGLGHLDRELRYVRVNHALASINGVPVESHLGRTLREVVPDVADSVEPYYRRAFASGSAVLNHEVRGYTRAEPETERVWLVHYHPVKSSDGSVVGIHVVVQDITTRKQLELELIRREERLRAALEVSGTGTYSWNLVTNESEWDDSLSRVFGLPSGERVSHYDQFLALVHPDDRANVVRECEKCNRERTDLSVAYRIVRPDGGVRWIHARGQFPRSQSNSEVMIGACIDVTDLRRAEDRFREVEAQQRAILEHLPVGIWYLDQDGQMIFGNKAAQEIWAGAPYVGPERFHEFKAWWHGSGEPLAADQWAGTIAVREGRTSLNQLLDIACFDGSRKTILNSAVPIFSEGRVKGVVVFNLDVTDQARDQAALRAKESRLRAMFESAAVGIAIVDTEGRWVEVNDTVCRITGYTRGELLARTFADLTFKDDLSSDLEQARALLAGQITTYSLDKRCVRKDGATNWVNLSVSSISGDGLEPRFLQVMVDISERKRIETMNRESKERLSAALAASQTGTFIWDIQTNTLDWDEELDRLFGRTPNQTARSLKEFFGMVHPDDRSHVAAACERCVRHGYNFHEEFRVVWPDGSVRWLDDKGKTFFDAEGKPTYMMGACVDITDRKRAEDLIRIGRERFELVREASGVGFWFCDLPFGRLDWDSRVKEHFGLPPEAEVTIETFFQRLHPEDRERTQAAIEFSIEQRKRYDVEYRTVAEDGTVRWIRAIGAAHFTEGETRGRFDGVTIDISDNVKAREFLQNRGAELEILVAQRTASLRETVEELEKFSYSISHDLRAPLRAMQSFAQFLTEDFGPLLPDEGKDYLRRIIVASERMDRLIQDLLSYSRQTRADVALCPVDLGSLIPGIVETYPQFREHADRIRIIGTFPTVLANEAALTQCLSNLLDNAVKFVAPNVAPQVRIWSEAQDDRVRIYVADNGIGIRPEHHEKIFGVFQRISLSYQGTGIGLAIVRKAMERMSGSVGVMSTLGSGSTFWLELRSATTASSP